MVHGQKAPISLLTVIIADAQTWFKGCAQVTGPMVHLEPVILCPGRLCGAPDFKRQPLHGILILVCCGGYTGLGRG